MKVVHVLVAGDIGGAERMVADLAMHPAVCGVEHAIALMTPNEGLLAMLRDLGLRVHDRGRVREDAAAFLWRSLGPLDVAWLTGVLREERADVVHLHTFASQVIGTRAARRVGARVVRTEHSTRAYLDPSCWPFSRWSLARSDTVVAISRHIRDVALARAPWALGKLRVVHDGVDAAFFCPREKRRDAKEPFAFIVVGRLEPRKGIDLALDALALVPEATLDVVGEGSERAALEARTRCLGLTSRVRFHGFVRDPRDIVAAADVALCSSREEGLGLAVLEAMAMGRPVVGFAVGGVPESVRSGENGWLAHGRTSAALAECMREAIASGDHVRRMGRAARELVERSFSVESMCGGYGRVYASLPAALTRAHP
jgi:glycosyltransferase involved in cell wall biosynthesis